MKVRLFLFSFLPVASLLAADALYIEDSEREGVHYLTEAAVDGKLQLTVNECFFPELGLRAEGAGVEPDEAGLNGGKSFAQISGWNKGDSAEWGLYLKNTGNVEVTLKLADGAAEDFAIRIAGVEEQLDSEGRGVFRITEPGLNVLRVICLSDVPATTKFESIELSGVEGGAVIRKRWRPAAAHAKFSSSKNPKSVKLWIMEMDAVPGTLDFYAPITTPFGYYGPTWKADGTVNSSLNFSLWSFGRGQKEPPIGELSHLLAIGDRSAEFGRFDHEGTGVKIRNWEPLKGRQGQSQVLALRLESDGEYETYYSYFYATDESQWKLLGGGRKKSKAAGKPMASLSPGSFVEVPGPPDRQRTGAYERRMRYRGWVVDAEGGITPIDQMSIGDIDKATGLTGTDRGVTDEGWFYLQTGGWTFRKPPEGMNVTAAGFDPKAMPFLREADLKILQGVPTSIEFSGIERKGTSAEINFTIQNPGENAEAFLYWGASEGLTFADRWENKIELQKPVQGINRYVLKDVAADAPLKLRLFIRNNQGQFWSMERH